MPRTLLSLTLPLHFYFCFFSPVCVSFSFLLSSTCLCLKFFIFHASCMFSVQCLNMSLSVLSHIYPPFLPTCHRSLFDRKKNKMGPIHGMETITIIIILTHTTVLNPQFRRSLFYSSTIPSCTYTLGQNLPCTASALGR